VAHTPEKILSMRPLLDEQIVVDLETETPSISWNVYQKQSTLLESLSNHIHAKGATADFGQQEMDFS